MESARITGSGRPDEFIVRDLLEDIVRQIEDLGNDLESLQDMAGELVMVPGTEFRRTMLLRLQLIDSLSQRVAALPALVRALKSTVPEDLAIEDPDSRRVFSAALCAYLGTTPANPAEGAGNEGDCEIWTR